MRSLNSNEVCLQSRQETQAAVDYRKRVKAFKPGCSFIEQPIPDQEADLGCAWVTGLERSWMNIMTFYVKGCAVRSKFKMLRTSQSWSELNMWSSEAFIFYFADVPWPIWSGSWCLSTVITPTSAADEVGDDELIQDLVAQLLERLQSDLDTTLTKTSHG